MINRQFFVLLLLFVALTLPIYAQTANEKLAKKYACSKEDIPQVVDYFNNLAETNKKWSAYYHSVNESSPKPRFPICWDGCAINLVKPAFPLVAKEYRIVGLVIVQAITDESGKVILAKALNGKPFIHQSSEIAACHSKFRPILIAGERIKFSFNILYNFILP